MRFPLLAAVVLWQLIPGSPFGGSSGGGSASISYPLLAPNGSSGAPSFSFSGHPTSGLLYNSTFLQLKGQDGTGTDAAGAHNVFDGGIGTGTGVGGDLFFRVAPPVVGSSSTPNSTQDGIIVRGSSTGVINIGGLDVTAPAVGTWAGADRQTGMTNGSGGGVDIRAGAGTGTGVGGDLRFFVNPPAAGSGSTQNGNLVMLTLSGTDAGFILGDVTMNGTPGVSSIKGAKSSVSTIAGGSLTLAGGAGFVGIANGGDLILNGGANSSTGTVGAVSIGGSQTATNLKLDRTVTAGGTTGAQTINKIAGTVNFAAAATSLVVTDSLVNTSSIVFTTMRTADTTCTFVKSVVPAAGSFTITVNAGCAAETSVGFWLTN